MTELRDETGTRLDASGSATLLVEEREDRLAVRLHRPEVRNAIDQAMVDELHAGCAHLERTPKILLLSGTPGGPETRTKAVLASGARTSRTCASGAATTRWPGSPGESSTGSPSCRCP
jgi:enoyl-CoA hydratase